MVHCESPLSSVQFWPMRSLLKGSTLATLPLMLTLLLTSLAGANDKVIDEYNVPSEVDACIKKVPGLSISGQINPFYLSGDFDGDGKLDFAIQVTRSGSL